MVSRSNSGSLKLPENKSLKFLKIVFVDASNINQFYYNRKVLLNYGLDKIKFVVQENRGQVW